MRCVFVFPHLEPQCRWYWLSWNQGTAMITNGVPNDVLSNFSPLTIIVAIPLLTFVIYPTLDRYIIHVGPVTRLTFGFFLAMVSSIVGTILQWRVYELAPCGYYASTCNTVAPISICRGIERVFM
ncbi:Oligopeptide transporter [Penicillium camemberti]|uniref:Oligopeptide transporter n=1 Tax=Penicillium camemberti (strain FM 013) TaxID=1429867 RepID=A0A0G4PS11_PENC3|nr:Oligopeptide transporter [Penicillium camemberti]